MGTKRSFQARLLQNGMHQTRPGALLRVRYRDSASVFDHLGVAAFDPTHNPAVILQQHFNLQITPEILGVIASIDEFNGA